MQRYLIKQVLTSIANDHVGLYEGVINDISQHVEQILHELIEQDNNEFIGFGMALLGM